MKRLRVAHVIPALFGAEGVFGGAERYAYELAKAMSVEADTTLFSFGEFPRRFHDELLSVEVVRNLLPFKRFRFDPIAPGLLMHLSRFDVIHVHQTHTFMADMIALIGAATGRCVVTTHLGGAGMGPHNWFDMAGRYRRHLHISEFSRTVFGHADRQSALVIGGGVSAERFHPKKAQPTRGFVLYAGRLLPHKGVSYLIEGLPPDVPLIVAGKRWVHASGYFERLQSLAVGKSVEFREDCTDKDLADLYRDAACIVLPSVYETEDGARYAIPELLGQTLIEGMSCGTPAICTAVGAMPEVVEDGVVGFVVPPNDPAALGQKIGTLWRDRSMLETFAANAKRRVDDHFRWAAVVGRCLKAYHEALDDKA